ncbi:MAG: peptidylprolyl isomerase [Bacillus sp. (in: firmicutes)]
MKKWVLPVALTAGLVSLTACSSEDGSKAVVETKAGNITQEQLYAALKETNGEKVLQDLVYEKILSEKYEVSDKELDERVKEVKDSLGDNFEMALAQSGLSSEEELKKNFKLGMLQEKAALKEVKATEEEMKEYYESYEPEIRASHILVEDEKLAKDLKKQLDEGADFAELAKEHSTDGVAEKGGDLDWFGKGDMVPEFEQAAYALKKGEISDPVQTENGYHLILLTDKKEKPSYEDMKKDIEYEVKVSKIDSATLQKVLEEELEAADVKIKDKDLEDAMATSGAES